MQKNQLRTVRFTSQEGEKIEFYLDQNPFFDSFSSLARVATLAFISKDVDVRFNPVWDKTQAKPPSFIWDYDLDEFQLREILSQKGLTDQKRWALERILSQASFDEVFDYLSVDQIKKYLPQLKLNERRKDHWQYAINRWTRND